MSIATGPCGIPENISGLRKGRHQAFVAIPENISGFSRRAGHFLRLAVEYTAITNVPLLLSIGRPNTLVYNRLPSRNQV